MAEPRTRRAGPARRELLAWLVVAFRPPSAQTLGALRSIDLSGLLAANGLDPAGIGDPWSGPPEELAAEYVRLFVNSPRGRVAHLEAAAYLAEDGPEVQTRFLSDLLEVLAEAGWTPGPGAILPPDHLARLLEFLYREGESVASAAGPDSFAGRFLAGWPRVMLDRLEAADPPAFYRAAGRVLQQVLA